MSPRSRLIFLAARLVPNVSGLATTALLTRLLEPAEYGVYALALSIIFFSTIGLFEWLGLSVLRMTAAARDSDVLLGTILSCFCGLCGLCMIGTVLILVLVRNEGITFLIIACLIATFATAWFEIRQRLQLAELREANYFWMSGARGLITMTLVCSAAVIFRNAPIIVLALAASNFFAVLIIPERRLRLSKCRFEMHLCRKLFQFGFPLSISVGMATILMVIDKWLLQALSGAQAVGFFTAATFVAQVPLASLAAGIGPPAYSMAVQALELRSPEAARVQLSQNFIVLLGIIAPAAAGIIALSHNLAHLMVGAAFWQPVILLAPWLALAAIFSGIRAFYVDTAFQLAHHNSPLIWIMLATVILNVAFDVLLIPILGELGAAIGSCCAAFIGLVVAGFVSRTVFPLPLPLTDSVKIIASTAIMFAVLIGCARYSGAWVLPCQIGVGGLVYGGVVIGLNVQGIRESLVSRFASWCRP